MIQRLQSPDPTIASQARADLAAMPKPKRRAVEAQLVARFGAARANVLIGAVEPPPEAPKMRRNIIPADGFVPVWFQGIQPECKLTQTLVEFDTWPGCTRKCSFCAPGIPKERRRQKHGLTLAAHNQVIDDLESLGYNRLDRWLCYCGHGEPTLNPDLVPMLRYARAKLPRCPIAVYTNGDPVTVELLCQFEALDLDTLIWDCYDKRSGEEFPKLVKASSLDPSRVRVNDYRKGMAYPSSRCSSVRKGNVKAWISKPCAMAAGKLFVTDDGVRPAFLLCCEDYKRESLDCGLSVARGDMSVFGFLAGKQGLLAELARGNRRKAHRICAKCDRDGGHPTGFDHVPSLVGSPFWPPPAPAVAVPEGKRLVIIPVNDGWVGQARVILNAIDKGSLMPGKTLVVWNDHKPCPPDLAGPTRIIWEHLGSLGWCGINRGIAHGLKYALAEGYDWVIKLDTDTAILRKGWDALLCGVCPLDSQTGSIMDVSISGQFPENNDKLEDGLFRGHIRRHVRWGHGLDRQGLRRWQHVQGGCYMLGREALARIDRIVGLFTDDQEHLHETTRVGEDVYIDSKCKVSKVPQYDTLLIRSWFRHQGESLWPAHVRYHRDALGTVVAHPVKKLEDLRALAEEMW